MPMANLALSWFYQVLVALSEAIQARLFEFGVSPNRAQQRIAIALSPCLNAIQVALPGLLFCF